MDVEQIIQLQGVPTPYRINSSYCQVTSRGKPYLFVFGGYDDTTDFFDDKIYTLDIERQTWLPSISTGIYRNGSSCVSLDDDLGNIFIIGGLLQDDEYVECLERSGNMKSQYQDCFILCYNLERNQFNVDWNVKFKSKLIEGSGEIGMDNWNLLNRLERHSIYLSKPNSKLYLSGGVISDLPYGMQNSMYILDFKRFTIEKVVFCKKIEHEILEFDNKIWSFGGINETMKNSFLNIQTYDLNDGTVNEFNLNLNNVNILSSSRIPKKKSQFYTVGYKKFFYNRMSYNQILITDLLNFQFIVLDIQTLKMYQVPIQIENLNWLFVLTYNDNLSIVGGELNVDNEIAYLDYAVSIPFDKFGKIESTESMNKNNILLKQFQDAYNEQKYVDFKIKSNDQKEIKVHKLYLLLQWPYFEKMIASGMLESQMNEMFIDESYENTKLLIDYLYSKEFPILDIHTLLSFAHLIELYDLKSLKKIIINRVYSSNISVNDLIEYWHLSNIINSPILKKYIQSMIFKFWGYVVRLPNFQNLEKEEMLELFTNLELESQIISNPLAKESEVLQQQMPTLLQKSTESNSANGMTNNSLLYVQTRNGRFDTVTPETEGLPTFEVVFRSPEVSDFWSALDERRSPQDASHSPESLMEE